MAENGPRDQFDDWFDEPEPADPWTTRVERLARARESGREVDDWIEETSDREPARARAARPRPPVLLGLAALGLVLLLGILAAAGVFSSGSRPRTLPTLPATTTTAPPPTTTAATTPTLPVPKTMLKPGATGSAVAQLQRALAGAGYSPGKPDGSYGPATKAAVAQFQQAHGLTADGIAGPKTLAALAAALQAGSG